MHKAAYIPSRRNVIRGAGAALVAGTAINVAAITMTKGAPAAVASSPSLAAPAAPAALAAIDLQYVPPDDLLLTLLRRYEAAITACDVAGDDAALSEAAWDDSCRWSREIVCQRPPATTAVSALAALDHVLADHDLWDGREKYRGLQMLWLLMIAARDYVAANAPKAGRS